MATFPYNFVVVVEGSNVSFAISGTIDETSPGASADNFEIGEVVTGTGFAPEVGATFQGTYSVGGETFVVIKDPTDDDFRVYGLSADPNGVGATLSSSLTSFAALSGDPNFSAVQTPICFLAGTGIATPQGDVAVEGLQIGDMVTTADGAEVAVKWIGHQKIMTLFGPAERLSPVRVRAGALGAGLPTRDLVLTADHALLIEGMLINAGALVNGDSIGFVPLTELGESFSVYHIETEAHEMILAEGTAAETYIDYATRRRFDNYDEYLDLYGETRAISEMAHPRISSARMLPESVKKRLETSTAA